MVQLKALDLFCGAGGAAMGLSRAGFEVTGIDIAKQRNFPFKFIQGDALEADLTSFDFIWASPPCQLFCALNGREDLSHYPNYIKPIREKLKASGKPWVIENVPGAPLREDLVLCGAMFGLRSYRHRIFESNRPLKSILHPKHTVRVNRRGENRREHWANGGFLTITGDIGRYCGPEAMGIDWMTGAEMSEAIPPAYSGYVANQILTTWNS
jgi:DNA (cytosine-5)-methyltransferase 1